MSKDRVIDSLGRIDDDMIQRVEALRQKKKRTAWKKWVGMAACLCLVAAGVAAIPGVIPASSPALPDIPKPPVHSEPNLPGINEPDVGLWEQWQADFNTVTDVMSGAQLYIPGYFTEELSAGELAFLEPDMKREFMQYSGHAGFDGDGKLVDVRLNVTTSIPENGISVVISERGTARDYIMDTELCVISVCGDVEYKVYQWDPGDGNTVLAADAKIGGYSFAFTMECSAKHLEQAKKDFSSVLECFTFYADGKPDLSAVAADEIPEWFDKSLSHQEALDDPDYGVYMLGELPVGFVEESIRRYKNQTSDYLSGVWTKGLSELNWSVSPFAEEDAQRLTDVEDRENYDLNLYPIPRAQSVPDELRHIVNDPIFSADELTMDAVWARAYKANDAGDTDGWRMRFSVRYGDVIVAVNAKGVDPEWVYQQLMGLISE